METLTQVFKTLPQLHDFPLWSHMQNWEMDELLRIVTTKAYRAGEQLFTPYDNSNRLYMLQHGRVKTYQVTPDGRMKIMHIFRAGEAFGALLTGGVDGQLPYAEAMDDVIVCSVDDNSLKDLMQHCPNICFGLIQFMAKHHAEDMKRIENMLYAKAIHKVLYALLAFGERLGFEQDPSFSIYPHFTHEDIANMVGLQRTTVSEQISLLRTAGVICGHGRHFVVDRAAAEAFLAC